MLNVPESLIHETELIEQGIIPIPRMAILQLNYKCNQNCYYCFFKKMHNDFVASKESILNILQQVKELGVKAIEWCGGGEPLLMPDAAEIFEKVHEMGLHQGLLTNGVLFNGKIMETFMKYGTYVRVSLDTVNPELYAKIRGSDDFKTVAENIWQAVIYKKLHDLTCDVSIKVGITNDTKLDDIKEIFKFFERWDISNIQVKNLWNKDGDYFNKDIHKKDMMDIDLHGQKIIRKVRYSKYMPEKCWLSPVQVTVDGYGDVYACCYYMYRNDRHKIGNLFKTPLSKLWGSDEHKHVIKNIRIGECLVHDCRFQKYMKAIRKLQKTGEWYHV